MAELRHTSRARWWLNRIVAAVLAGLLIAIGVDYARGGITAIWLRYAGVAAYGAPGERLEITAGHSLYLDCRGIGSPTLVLEAGMGSDSATWSPVLDELTGISRTCAYDRTGRGRSDGGSAGDLAGMSSELAALLAAAGEPAPYVIVGHSLGTVIGRVHASLHEDDVAGLVLIDGFDPDIFDAAVLPNLGPIRDQYVDDTVDIWGVIGSVERIDVEASRAQLAASDVEGLPIEVIVAPRIDSRLDAATNERILDAVAAAYEGLSPGRVTFTRAWGASHMIQFDQPDVVVEAVRRIVEGFRGG
jgi:pimeloyl-ACP methyl ester carboxylesterase